MFSQGRFVDGCKSCQQFEGKSPEEVEALEKDYVLIGRKRVWWVLLDISPKGAETHLIFTTLEHVSPEEDVVRALLIKTAMRIAARRLGDEYRLAVNSGLRTSTRTHFHAHILSPGENERLPRVVADVQKVISEDLPQEFPDLPEEVVEFLDKNLLQQKV